VRDAEQIDVVGPAVRLLCGFMDTFGDKLLAIAQHLNLVGDIVGRFERHAYLLERCRATKWDQPFRRLANTLEDCAAANDVEQRLLHLVRNVLVPDIDVEARRVARADAGAERAGIGVRPRRDHVLVRRDGDAHILPAVERRPLAPRHHRDRLVAELQQSDATRRDGNAQLLMRQRRRSGKWIIVVQCHCHML
jgi:hypothetical protein